MPEALFHSPHLTKISYGPGHPFQVERLEDLLGMLGALELLPPPPVETGPATREEIARGHDLAYLDALEAAETLPPRETVAWGFGAGDNPVFPGLWESCRLIAGGSLAAARWLRDRIEEGEDRPRAFHPGGGLHHAHRARAAGFCYVNDPVLAIRVLVDAGLRVLYVDVDAHHGDGVQEAFYASRAVLTVSIHQDGRTLFPGTGFPNESGSGDGAGYAVNFPLLPGAGDEEHRRFQRLVLEPLKDRYRPDVLVTEIGVDALPDDPLALLEWSLCGLDDFLRWADGTDLPWLSFGGGGYRRWNVIRGWSLVWARMRGRTLPEERPAHGPGGPLPESWPRRFWDEPPSRHLTDPQVRREHFDQVLSFLQERVFPRIGT
ncbi:MAG: acetoin utilization protein AcuC [Candidatus Eisenbacteria bacterium]|nr:acetoin utilization protein AcuC [Candidatus Latescibacterota bacterium]MBD3301397.1 acetoin utilization protein AcuC [Candidatus Eisenbacteria bacterium]